MDAEAIVAIFNIAGRGTLIHGFGNEKTNTDLWMIKKGRSSSQEVISRLQALPAVLSAYIAVLSKPVKENELEEVRELFTHIGWDASGIVNETLAVFLNSHLLGQTIYYIDHDARQKAPVKIKIKPLEEHPHFSPEWLKVIEIPEDETEDRDLTMDDLEVRTVTLSLEENPPPPPDIKG